MSNIEKSQHDLDIEKMKIRTRKCEEALNAAYLGDKKRAERQEMTMEESLKQREESKARILKEFGQEVFDKTLENIKEGSQ